MLKQFFFWGIFTNLNTVRGYFKVEPKRFLDASYKSEDFSRPNGKFVDYSHLPDDEFYRVLGILAWIETGYKLHTITCILEDGSKEEAWVYIPLNEWFRTHEKMYSW